MDIRKHMCALFSERESLDEAMGYAHAVIERIQGADRFAAMTALYVVINTIGKEMGHALFVDQEAAE